MDRTRLVHSWRVYRSGATTGAAVGKALHLAARGPGLDLIVEHVGDLVDAAG